MSILPYLDVPLKAYLNRKISPSTDKETVTSKFYWFSAPQLKISSCFVWHVPAFLKHIAILVDLHLLGCHLLPPISASTKELLGTGCKTKASGAAQRSRGTSGDGFRGLHIELLSCWYLSFV